MDMEFVTLPSREPASTYMGLSIEPETDNRGEEEKGEHITIEKEKEREKTTVWLTEQHLV
jgi:hypothetical protein